MDFDLPSVISFGTRKSERKLYQSSRKRFARYWISGRLSRFLFQQSSMSFHAFDERPNFEASIGLEGRLPFTTARWTFRSETSGKGSLPVNIWQWG